MNIKILTFEKHQDRHLRELEAEYLKRVSPYCKIEMATMRREKIKKNESTEQILSREAETVLHKLSSSDYLVVLDLCGKSFDTHGFSTQVKQWQNEGVQSLVFFIGGPLGVGAVLKKKAKLLLSLSQLTFTHEMTRMLLSEVLYRSFDILNNGNYHK